MLGFSHTLNVMYRVRAGAVEDVCVCVCVCACTHRYVPKHLLELMMVLNMGPVASLISVSAAETSCCQTWEGGSPGCY